MHCSPALSIGCVRALHRGYVVPVPQIMNTLGLLGSLIPPRFTKLTIHRPQNTEEHSDILTNLEAAQKHLDFLTSGFLHALDALPSAISNSLQTAPPPQQQQQQAASVSALASASAPAPALAESQKVKKVRMKRVPKGVVPGVTPPPDPERWLKKSERATFGQGRRRKGGGGATQGAMEPAGGAGKSVGGGKGKKKK